MNLYEIETKGSSRTFFVVAPSAEDSMTIWRENWDQGSHYRGDYIVSAKLLHEGLILPKEVK
jgi:hypothetical protein